MTQATAARERARITQFLSENRDPEDTSPRYTGGPMWTLPKKQVQALYVCTGSYPAMLEVREEMVPWPPQTPGRPVVPPPDHVLFSWTREIDAGETDPDPKLVKIMDERIKRRFLWQVRKGITTSSEALQFVGRKVMAGTVNEAERLSLLPLGQATNYGVGNYAALVKAMNDTTQPTIQIGSLMLNAGPPPAKRLKVAKRAKQPAIEAEYSEVE